MTLEVELLAPAPTELAIKATPTAGVTPAGTPKACHCAGVELPSTAITYAVLAVKAELSILRAVPLTGDTIAWLPV